MTSGVLRRTLFMNPTLAGVTHVVLDEVHEREAVTDFLATFLKDLVATTRPDLKLVLMSANLQVGAGGPRLFGRGVAACAAFGGVGCCCFRW